MKKIPKNLNKYENQEEKLVVVYSIDLLPEYEMDGNQLVQQDEFVIFNFAFLANKKYTNIEKKQGMSRPILKAMYEKKLSKIFDNHFPEIWNKKGDLKLDKLDKWLSEIKKILEKEFCISTDIELMTINVEMNYMPYVNVKTAVNMLDQLSDNELEELAQMILQDMNHEEE